MKTSMRIALAQINATVGDLDGNGGKITSYAKKAVKQGVDLIVFPELAVTGYPPEDLLLKPAFISDNIRSMESIAKRIKGIKAVVGFVDRDSLGIYNAAAFVDKGKICAVYRKMILPNYGVFDEKRYFTAGGEPLNIDMGGVNLGLGICEDIWHADGPAALQAKSGASVIVNINASPYHYGKAVEREKMLSERARSIGAHIVYVNMVGGQDELVFDGQSIVVDDRGRVVGRAAAFSEDLFVADIEVTGTNARKKSSRVKTVKAAHSYKARKPAVRQSFREQLTEIEEVKSALVLGLLDYVRKNGFGSVIIGISGGVDSALVAALSVEALGKDKVTGVFMPSKYTSKASREDAELLCENLGIELITVPIDTLFKEYLKALSKVFYKRKPDVTEENLQARIRGNIMMAISNKFGSLVVTTGNKSEMGVGYATLYGDMAGGFALIKDVPKTMVYELCEEINASYGEEVIPERIFTKAPSAELKPNQTDQDTLPPYDDLDEILREYVEEDAVAADIIKMGYPEAEVRKVIRMVDGSEYKRRQAPPGVKITPKAFGRDRRMPLTNRYGRRK